MKTLITGICGFVGSTLAMCLRDHGHTVCGCDNFIRPGSETNREKLKSHDIAVYHADLRNASDVDSLPACDWVIDAAANPSVLAGVDGSTSSRQLIEHNLNGTINILEYCKARNAGLTLLSTSRVYAIRPLAKLEMRVHNEAFVPVFGERDSPHPSDDCPPGLSPRGVAESFSTTAPISLYGSTKLASEVLALEYGATFGFPVWINRCGVLAGAGQFGKADQGIFSFWIHSWKTGRPLRYIGFGASGHQVRDCLHPRDLVPVLESQFATRADSSRPQIVNLSGGVENSMSLAQLSAWCRDRLGPSHSDSHISNSPLSENRPFDIPWMVLDPTLASEKWDWRPATPIQDILEEIAQHAEANPRWLDLVS